jgi:hypothetical protein
MQSEQQIENIDTPEGHQNFMRAQWKDFAAFAWNKYSGAGRGAVVIDLRRATKELSGLRVPVFYVAQSSEQLDARGGWPDEEIARAVEDYIPEEEVLFLFLRRDGQAFHYIASDDPAPPRAAHQLTRRRNSR